MLVSLAVRIVKWAFVVVAFVVMWSPRTYGLPDVTRVCLRSICYQVTAQTSPPQNTLPEPTQTPSPTPTTGLVP